MIQYKKDINTRIKHAKYLTKEWSKVDISKELEGVIETITNCSKLDAIGM